MSLIRWLPTFIWAGVIFSLSSLPILQAEQTSLLDFIFKKSAHVTEYAILFLCLSYSLSSIKYRFHYAFLIGLLYAFSDESHQLFTPGRGGKLSDVLLFDQLGLILAWLFLHRYSRLRRP